MSDLPESKIFIPGYIDTTQKNGLKVRAINTASLVNGFELLSNDSSLIVERFNIVFDDSAGNLHSKPSQGNKILNDGSNIAPLNKISQAKLITIENIIIQYRKKCYKIKGQAYIGLQ